MANHQQTYWRWLFGAAAVEAGVAGLGLGFTLIRGPQISGGSVVVFGTFIGCSGLWTLLFFRPPRSDLKIVSTAVVLCCALFSLLMSFAIFLLRYLEPETLGPYYTRLSPLLWYLFVLGLESSAVLAVLKFGLHPRALVDRKALLLSSGVALLLLLAAFIFVSATGTGLIPDTAYWGEPGVPVLGWQLALAILAGAAALIASLAIRTQPRLDGWAAVGVWLVAVIVWLSVPSSVMRNSFYAPMTPPANQPFPNSDAGYYDSMSESLLIGHPYQGEIPTRPLYIVVLTALHLVAGQDYGAIIVGQTLVLAFIPVVILCLGSTLHSLAAGLIAALLAIFREWTSLMVSSQTRVSNTRTLLVDLPTLLLVSLACLLAVHWLARRDNRSALLAGGIFGLLLLLRTQSALIIPILLLIAAIVYGFRTKEGIAPGALFMAGLVAAILPWLVHNFLVSGSLAIDAPFQYRIIASQYQYTGNLDINNIDLRGKSLPGILLAFVLRDPRFVFGFIATHFFATEINGLLALPLLYSYGGLHAPVNLYWLNWNGSTNPLNLLLMIGYLVVIAFGVGAAWRRLRWPGLIPIFVSLAYALANGIGRFSGWRYDLPADWVPYFYFALGVAEVLGVLALLLGSDCRTVLAPLPAGAASKPRSILVAALLLGFLLVGSTPWMAQGLSRPLYADQDPLRLANILASSSAVRSFDLPASQLQDYAASPMAVLRRGRLLYPRFFSRNTGLASAHPWPAYEPRDYPRLGFLLLNQNRQDAIFPARQLQGSFPQGSDVIVLGCQRPDYIDVRLMFFPELGSAYLAASALEPCE